MAQNLAPTLRRCAVLAFLFCMLSHAFYAYILMQDSPLPYRVKCALFPEPGLHAFFDPMNFGCKPGEYISMHYNGDGWYENDADTGKCICNPDASSNLPNTTGSIFVDWIGMKSTFVIVTILLIMEMAPVCRRCYSSPKRSFCTVTWGLNWKRRKAQDEQVRREVVRSQCEYARKCMRVAKIVLLALLTLRVLRFNLITYPLTVGPPPPSGKLGGGYSVTGDTIRQDLIGSEILPVLLACVVFVILGRMKDETLASWLDWANVIFSVMWIWRFCTLSSKWYSYYQAPSWACRIFQGIIFGNCWLSIVLQLFVTIVDILCSNTLGLLRSTDRSKSDEGHSMGYVLGQVVLLGFVFCILWSFDFLRKSEAEQLIKAKRSDQASALAFRLLSAMSDAVVHLDVGLNITEPCPKLAGLMLRSSTGAEMVGQRFVDFLTESDRERFELNVISMPARAKGEGSDTAVVHAMHVHLCDASHTQFPIEVFAAFIPGVDGSNGYVIGIKEEELEKRHVPDIGEQAGKAKDVISIPESISLHFPPNSSTSCIPLKSNKSGSSSSCTSRNSWKDSDLHSIAGDDEEENMDLGTIWVCVDAASDTLEIICCSFAFSCMVKCPGFETTSLKALIPEEKLVVVKSFLTASNHHFGSTLKIAMKPKHKSLKGFSAALGLADNPEALLASCDSNRPATVLLTDLQYDAASGPSRKAGQMSVVVTVGNLTCKWARAANCDKIYSLMLKDKHSFRTALVEPEDLVERLKACCAEWVQSERQSPELPHELGAFSLNGAFFKQSMGSYIPRLAIAIKDFVRVAPANFDKAKVVIAIELRFERCSRNESDLKLSNEGDLRLSL